MKPVTPMSHPYWATSRHSSRSSNLASKASNKRDIKPLSGGLSLLVEGIAKGALKLPSQPLLISFLELSFKFEIIYFPLDFLLPIFQMFREINHEIINLFENKHFKKCGG